MLSATQTIVNLQEELATERAVSAALKQGPAQTEPTTAATPASFHHGAARSAEATLDNTEKLECKVQHREKDSVAATAGMQLVTGRSDLLPLVTGCFIAGG